MSDFDVFANRWEITAKLSLVTPMRIGGGQNAGAYSLSQVPVLLSYDAQTQTANPYIPGSSLKGVLRSTVERIVRTVNEKEACISVSGERNRDVVLCGKDTCITCSIFGSMNAGSSIRVLDAQLSENMNFGTMLGERVHCATEYERVNGLYQKKMDNRGRRQKPKTSLRQEEVVAANLSFDVNIKFDNADEHEVGLVLLALEEFNHRRCYLGGGVSRGYGFADVDNVEVIKKTVSESSKYSFEISAKQEDPNDLINSSKDYLRDIDDEQESDRRDFDIYYRAYTPTGLAGHLVIKYKLETLTDFQMQGADEITVTNQGVPVIPGSIIKGFLRHRLIEDKIDASVIDEIFGSVRGGNQHRARLLFSDAIPDEDFSEGDKIPAGVTLTMWAVFDNVSKEEIQLIDAVLKSDPVITGNTSAKNNERNDPVKNKVKFKPLSFNRFNVEKYISR